MVQRIEGSRPEAALAGRYDDTLVRENGTWKFLERVAAPPVDKDAAAARSGAPAAK